MADQLFTGSLKPGSLLDKYEVREQLVAGGMAIIYKAYDPSLDRYVAIKQVAPHLASDEKFAVRFRQEAQTLARLSASQANIVHVHELIQQDGQLYLVMEYVEGTTLRAMLDRGPVPLQTGLGILLSTALGLRAMHAQGIVHRDLTPNNIMMAKDGALKITDFGLIGHSGGRTSLPMGTTKYMAPETFTGALIDPRADLYSLGMIALEMFAGPEKFGEAFKDVLRDEKAQQVRWMHWHSNPGMRAPSLRDLQPGIPPLVAKIVERLLEKDPSKRFASADQIVRWLRRIFVMHVQGKSIPQTDSEAMEKEMEAEAAAPVVRPVVAVAAVGAPRAGLPGVESGERTAPLPQVKWTWKRALFWGSVIAGPLILIAATLVILKMREESSRISQARDAQRLADEMFHSKDYPAAIEAYMRIVQDFSRDLNSVAMYAMQHATMARAEDALQKKDYAKADEYANTAQEKYGAEQDWISRFRTRFTQSKDIDEKMALADAAQKAGNFEGAIAIYTDLVAHYTDLKVNERIAELTEQVALRGYQSLIRKANDAIAKRKYNDAYDYLAEARKNRETPEVLDMMQALDNLVKSSEAYAQAEKDAADGKWDRAYEGYKRVMDISPSEAVRTKMNIAKAEGLWATAKSLKDAGQNDEARTLAMEVLKFNPNHADALKFIQQQNQAKTLAGFIAGGDDAMAKEQWEALINSFSMALPLLDSKDDATKKRLEDQITEARYRLALGKARDAFARDDFDGARRYITEALGYKDTPEAKALLEQVNSRESYKKHLTLGKTLMGQGRYMDARKEFLEARKVSDTQEVRTLLADCDYLRAMSQGKQYLNTRQYLEAKAQFNLALAAKRTPEAEAYYKEAERLAIAAGKKPGEP